MRKNFFILISGLFFLCSCNGCMAGKHFPENSTQEQMERYKDAPTVTHPLDIREIPSEEIGDMEKYVLDGFPHGKSTLSNAHKSKLNEILNIPDIENAKIEILGFADKTRDPKYLVTNLQLSKNRAEAVKKYFLQRGIPAENISTRGMGENDDHPCLDKNRRVEICIRSLFSPEYIEPRCTKPRFDKEIPLIPEPQKESGYPKCTGYPTSYSELNEWLEKNDMLDFQLVESGSIVIGYRRNAKNPKYYDVLHYIFYFLMPLNADEFTVLGLGGGKDWKEGKDRLPANPTVWIETLPISDSIVCRNAYGIDRKNKCAGYARINQARREQSIWAKYDKELGIGNKNNACIAYKVQKGGPVPIK